LQKTQPYYLSVYSYVYLGKKSDSVQKVFSATIRLFRKFTLLV
jgi:hypothetical protein